MRLEVLIATHGEQGLDRIAQMQLPRVEGVDYVVTWQAPHGDAVVPDILKRDDLRIVKTDSRGSGANRNNALAAARGDILLMSDNDLRYTAADLLNVLKVFKEDPKLEMAIFRYRGTSKVFPTETVDLQAEMPRNFFVATFQIAVRRDAIEREGIRFNEDFGVNARFECGEDGIFFIDCMRKRLVSRYFPIDITVHPGETTGTRRITKRATARGEGAVIRYKFGMKGFPRVALFIYRNLKRGRLTLLPGAFDVITGFLTYHKAH